MRTTTQAILITLFLFSCRTSYDSNYAIQCNENQIKQEIELIEENKKKYIDSIFEKAMLNNNINELSSFINNFPESRKKNEAVIKRRSLFLDRKNIIQSNLNIDSILLINPCYTPIYKNIDYINNINIKFEQLFNSELDSLNPYRNRFVLANLNTSTKNGKSKGVKEIHFNIKTSSEFKELFDVLAINNIKDDSIVKMSKEDLKVLILDNYNISNILTQFDMYINYHHKIKKYQKEEIEKEYSIYSGYKHAGQELCFCEISNDTILLVSKHLTSARGKSRSSTGVDSTTGKKKYRYFDALPTKKDRKYYAPHYLITIRNWDTQRKYDKMDIKRDSITGGGNSRVTFFDNRTELPNFLLMEPDKKYPKAMKRNGIHEGSLSNMSRCMLGTPQSLGCLRTTDYGSKFSRWWIPKYANLFIYYDEDLYLDQQVEKSDITGLVLPFSNKKEGNKFRKWINKYYPEYAKDIDLDETGSCDNCFMQIAWEKYHLEYLKTDEGIKLNYSLPESLSITKDQEPQKKMKNKENNIDTSRFKIQKEFQIIIGCFRDQTNAKKYTKKIIKKGFPTNIFYNEGSQCYLVGIGPYSTEKNAKKDLSKIKSNIENNAWIFTKMIK